MRRPRDDRVISITPECQTLLAGPASLADIREGWTRSSAADADRESGIPITPEVVALRAELARIERHPALAGSPRLRLLLRYLFEESLAGRGEVVTQYSIAFDCYQIGKDFDSSANTLIRSHARRLRKALLEATRPHSSVRISMAERGYQLTFETPTRDRAYSETISRPSLGIIGFESAQTGIDARADPILLAEEILIAIRSEGPVRPVGPFARTGTGECVAPSLDIARREKLDFLLLGRIDEDASRSIVAIRVIDGITGHQLWAANHILEAAEVSREVMAGFARTLVSQITSDWGILTNHLGAAALARKTGPFTPFEAVVLARLYLTHFHFERLDDIIESLRKSSRSTQDAAVPATLAVLLGALGGVEPRWNQTPDQQEIRELAAIAARLAPGDPWTRLALASSAVLDGRRAELSEMARRADSEPETPAMLVGALGTLVAVQALDSGLAGRMIDRFRTECATYPRVVHLALAITALTNGDTHSARDELSRFGVPWGWASPLVRAACSALEGDAAEARREWARVLDAFPDFPSRWRETVATLWHESHLTTIFRVLESAGIRVG